MEFKVGIKLSKQEVFELLTRFDDSSYHPLHEGLNFNSYSEKLSTYALFILAYKADNCMAFTALYLNDVENCIYIPQIVVHKEARHQGLGHQMLDALYNLYTGKYETIKLEVLKDNLNAQAFYIREGFSILSESADKYLLTKTHK